MIEKMSKNANENASAKDPAFEKFVLRYINVTWSRQGDHVLDENVHQRCPANMQALCQKMWDSLQDSVNTSKK